MKTLLFISALALNVRSVAQINYDELFHGYYNYYGNADIGDSDISLSQFKFGFNGGYGFVLNDKEDQLNIGMGYEFFGLENTAETNYPLKIHNSSLGIDYLRNWENRNWASTLSLGIALVSDYKTNSDLAYQTSLAGMLHYGKSYDVLWTFGLLYSGQPFGPWIFPILGVDWKISNRVYFHTILFSRLYLEYQIKYQKLYVGVDLSENGQSFVLSDYQNERDSYAFSFSDRFPYYPFDNTLFLDYYTDNGFVFYLKSGIQIAQGFFHYTSNHDPLQTSFYNATISPSFTAKIGLAYRIRKF